MVRGWSQDHCYRRRVMVEELVAHLLVECAALVAGAVLAEVLRWLVARLGNGRMGSSLASELAGLAQRIA